jgi:hypothetical protein
MANLISFADGNFTAAGSWEVADTTSANVSTSTSSTALTVATQDSTAFTPGAITVDGIAVKLGSRASGTPTNTITVTLRNTTAGADVKSVTANVSDLPVCDTTQREGGWHFFRFDASTLLIAGNNYVVRCNLSATTTAVSLMTDGTAANWQRLLRVTTTQAPAAGDDMFGVGEFDGSSNPAGVVTRAHTMNSTAATDYGSANTSFEVPAYSLSKGYTLTNGTTAATNYILRVSGHITTYANGTLNIGTTGTPIPRDSSAIYELDCAVDGDFALTVRNLSTWSAQGLSRTSGKNIFFALLNTDEAAGQTTLGVDTDTGWLNGDEVAIGSTTRTASEREQRTMNADAGASSISVSAGLTNAHSGTSPTQAEVILLTRNVKVRSVTSGVTASIDIRPTATVDVDWVEFRRIGTSGADPENAFTINTTTGSCNVQFSSSWESEGNAFEMLGAAVDNFTLSNNVVYAPTALGFSTPATTGTTWTISNNIVIGSTTAFSLTDAGGTITGNRASSCSTQGFSIADSTSTVYGTISGNIAHSTAGAGFVFSQPFHNVSMGSFTAWRNSGPGIQFNMTGAMSSVTIDTISAFGNTTHNIQFGSGVTFTHKVLLKAVTSNGDSTFATTNGIQFNTAAVSYYELEIENSNFSTASGILTAHTNDINLPVVAVITKIILRSTILAAATEIANTSNLRYGARISKQRADQTDATHNTLTAVGSITHDTSVFRSSSPSERLTPTSATLALKLKGGERLVAVADTKTITITAYVRKDGTYAGNAARLMLKANPALGVNSDTVIDTHSAAADTWEELTGTTAAAIDNGVFTFYVDCDGSAGNIYDDDWNAVQSI